MFDVRQTLEFQRWFTSLRDRRAHERIAQRIVRLQAGLFGDVKFFKMIGELRIDHGPGYRLYFVKRGKVVVILLCGGDKSTQTKDIKKAMEMAENLESE